MNLKQGNGLVLFCFFCEDTNLIQVIYIHPSSSLSNCPKPSLADPYDIHQILQIGDSSAPELLNFQAWILIRVRLALLSTKNCRGPLPYMGREACKQERGGTALPQHGSYITTGGVLRKERLSACLQNTTF